MNTVTVNDNTLVVEPEGLDKLWSFTRKIEIPLDHVRGATHDPGMNAEPKGLRGPGLGLPGKWAGTFTREGEKSFWNVSDHTSTVVIELAEEDYTRLVLTVAEPAEIVQTINSALGSSPGHRPHS